MKSALVSGLERENEVELANEGVDESDPIRGEGGRGKVETSDRRDVPSTFRIT